MKKRNKLALTKLLITLQYLSMLDNNANCALRRAMLTNNKHCEGRNSKEIT